MDGSFWRQKSGYRVSRMDCLVHKMLKTGFFYRRACLFLTLKSVFFRQIEATEYVDDLYELNSKYGTPSLSLFAELVNREMMWAIGEIVSESHSAKRMRVIKQFIKIARQCKETQNFNSMFAIISGLGHGAVSRLKSSWEKLPSKYQRLFNEMQQLMDPSRNMSRYR